MKISGWVPRNIQAPPSVVLLPALFLFNCFDFSAWNHLSQVSTRPWLLLVWLYGLVGLLPLALRDRAPIAVFAIQCVHTLGAWPMMEHYVPVVGIPVALYAVSVHCGKEISLLALFVSFIPDGFGVLAALWTSTAADQAIRVFIANATFIFFTTIGAWGAGRLTQASRQRVQQLERAQKSIQKATQEAVAEERGRIARELHDIVSHAVTGILLQAAVAQQAPDDHTRVQQSLMHIEMMGKRAMAELRRLLGVLERSDPTDHTTGHGELRPPRGLADLTALLATGHANGKTVTVHEEGIRRDLDPSVDLAAYRIVQEGLTNILRHAGEHSNPQLRLIWEDQKLIIVIDNGTNLAEASCGPAPSVGHGLVGLRERAHAVGGHLCAGPHSEVGYRLTASLPFAAPAVPQGVPSAAGSCPCPTARGIKERSEYDPSHGRR